MEREIALLAWSDFKRDGNGGSRIELMNDSEGETSTPGPDVVTRTLFTGPSQGLVMHRLTVSILEIAKLSGLDETLARISVESTCTFTG